MRRIDVDIEKVKKLYAEHSLRTVSEILGISRAVLAARLRVAGIDIRKNEGPNHHSFKGYRTHGGYRMLKAPDHPEADAMGYVFEHRLVAERMLGRPLKYFGVNNPDNESVHHRNHDKKDNRPENLEILTRAEHGKLHGRRLTQKQVREIRASLRDGKATGRILGKQFRRSESAISQIKLRLTYADYPN